MQFIRAAVLSLTAGSALGLLAAAAAQDTPQAVVARAVGHEIAWPHVHQGEKWHRQATILMGPSGWAYVDLETGVLIGLYRADGLQPAGAGGLRVDAAQAQAAAIAFLGRVGVPPAPPWVLAEAGFHDRVEGSGEYYFTYRKFVNGIQLPADLYVTIAAADGEVNNYNLMDDRLTIPLVAHVSADQAAALIARKAGFASVIVEEALPRISYFPHYPGRQAILWHVKLRNPAPQGLDPPFVIGEVDAVTGQIGSIEAPGGGGKGQPAIKSGKGTPVRASPVPKVDLEAASKVKPPPTVFELAKRDGRARELQEPPGK